MDQAPLPTVDVSGHPPLPSAKQQSWGAVISIVVILIMVTVGAFYAWGARIAKERAIITPVQTPQ